MHFSIRSDQVDEGKRTVRLAFSSETPVERYDWWRDETYDEVLDHGAESVRLGFLKDGGPFLVHHDTRDMVGVVESVSIDSDRVGRAVVRFGKSARAEEIFRDIVDGIRKKISVGYVIHEVVKTEPAEGRAQWRVTDWEPLEISTVPIPADPSVGVGRSKPKETQRSDPMDTPNPTPTPPAPAQPTREQIQVIESAAQERANRRNAELAKVFSTWVGLVPADKRAAFIEAYEKAVADPNVQPHEFGARALSDFGKPAPISPGIGMSQGEVRDYSISKALREAMGQSGFDAARLTGLEAEAHKAAVKAYDGKRQYKGGLIVPQDVLLEPVGSYLRGTQAHAMAAFGKLLGLPSGQRDLTVGSATAGGNLVGTNLLAGSFIDILRNKALMLSLGVQVLGGLRGNVAIPKQSGAATAYWVNEAGDVTESQQSFGQVTMSPKTVGALSEFTRQLLLQSTPAIDGLVMADLIRVLALAIDLAIIAGTGSSGQPTGILNQSGVLTVTGASYAWEDAVEHETDVADANADLGSMAYVTTPVVRGLLKTRVKESGFPQYLCENNQMNGYPVYATKQMSTATILFGVFSEALLGMWEGLEITEDPYTKAESGNRRIVALQSVDVAVRNAVAFSAASSVS